MNLSGLKYFPSDNGSEERVTLPVFVGEVAGTGVSLEAAIKDAIEKRTAAEAFAVEAVRVRRLVFQG